MVTLFLEERMEIRNNSLKNQVGKMNEELEEMQKKLAPIVQNMQETNGKNSPK